MQSTIINKMAALFLIAAVLCSLFPGCAEKKPQPADTISQLQDAINKFDMNGLLRCIDSEWAGRIESLLALTVGDEGISVGSFFTLAKTVIPILPLVSDGTINSDDLPKVEFTVLKTDISGLDATVALSGMLTWGEYSKPFAATVDMRLENDVWVVCGVS